MPDVADFYAAKQTHMHTGARVYTRHRRAAEALLRFTRPPRTRLLDIGCGEGLVASYLALALGCEEAHGVEISAQAAERACARGVTARALNLDDGPLPYPDRTFDVVLCSEVIEHVVDTDHLLEEIMRTLVPGGVAAITTPNLASWVNRLALALGWQPFTYDVSQRYKVGRPGFGAQETSGHLHMFTHRALRELLTRHGFELLAMEGIPASDPPIRWAGESMTKAARPPLYVRAVLPFDHLLARRSQIAFGLLAVIRKPNQDAVR